MDKLYKITRSQVPYLLHAKRSQNFSCSRPLSPKVLYRFYHRTNNFLLRRTIALNKNIVVYSSSGNGRFLRESFDVQISPDEQVRQMKQEYDIVVEEMNQFDKCFEEQDSSRVRRKQSKKIRQLLSYRHRLQNMEKKRSANWGEGERVLAVQLIHENAGVIFGKFRGASLGAKAKERVWQDIADQLNASGQASCVRAAVEIKKMYGNIKSRAKEKYDSSNKTGGGPAVAMTPTEELVLTHLMANNKSQLKGMEDGIDSMICQPAAPTRELPGASTCTFPVAQMIEVFEGNNIIDSINNTAEIVPLIDHVDGGGDNTVVKEIEEKVTDKRPLSTKVGRQKTPKRCREDTEDELYALEKKRLLLEIEAVEEKKYQQHQLFLIQKNILEKQLK